MGMRDKRKKIQNLERISRWCLCGMFFIFVATAFFPIPELLVKAVSTSTSCLFLLSNVMRYQSGFGKQHIGMWCFCVLCMLLMIACVIWSYVSLRICSVWATYGYYLTTNIRVRGGVRRQSILFFICSCCAITVSMCVKHVAVTGVVLALQFMLLIRLLDPALHVIATRHRDKRLQQGEEIYPEHVTLLRKVLFGQNGKLEIPGMER